MDKQVYYRVPESHAAFIEDYARQKGISKNSAATLAITALMEQDIIFLMQQKIDKLTDMLDKKEGTTNDGE